MFGRRSALILRLCIDVERLVLRTEDGTLVGSQSVDKVGEDVMEGERWRWPWQLGGVVGSSPPHVLFGGLVVLRIWSAGKKVQVQRVIARVVPKSS